MADWNKRVQEAATRIREAKTDAEREDAITALNALQLTPPSAVEEIPDSLLSSIRESARKEAGGDTDALREQLRETQGKLSEAESVLSKISDVSRISEAVKAAGVEDKREVKWFVDQAQVRGLREADDIRDMVDTHREFERLQEERRLVKLQEAFGSDYGVDIEGVMERRPEAAADGGERALREAGIPLKAA